MNPRMLINILLGAACLLLLGRLRQADANASKKLVVAEPAPLGEGVSLHDLPESSEYRSKGDLKDIYSYDLFTKLRGKKEPVAVVESSTEPEKFRPPEPDWKGLVLRNITRFGDQHVVVIQLEVEPPKPVKTSSRSSRAQQEKAKAASTVALKRHEKILSSGESFEWKGRELTLKEIGESTVILSAEGEWEHELLVGLDEEKRIQIYEQLLSEMSKNKPKPEKEKKSKDEKKQQQAAAIAKAMKQIQDQKKKQQQQNNTRGNRGNRGSRGGF